MLYKCLICLLIALVSLVSSQEDRGYIVVTPKELYGGSNATVCFYFKNIKDTDAVVTLNLLELNADFNGSTIFATHKRTLNNVVSDVWECLNDFSIPPYTKYISTDLNVNIVFPSLPDNYMVNETKRISYSQQDDLFFVETDKDKYKFGQTVYFRLLSLDKNLLPQTESIPLIYIEDPNGARMRQWRNVNMDKGLLQLDFKLTEEPVEGSWNIHIKRGKGKTDVQRFSVEDYILPKFSVTITPEQEDIPRTTPQFTWTICAEYTFGQPVVGTFTHELRTRRRYGWGPFYGPVPPPRLGEPEENIYFPFSGCEKVTLNNETLNLTSGYVYNVGFYASVREEGTGIEQNATEYTSIQQEQRINVDVKEYSGQYFKPGLLFTDELVVNRGYRKPAPGEAIKLCVKYLYKKNDTFPCQELISDNEGIVKFQVLPVEMQDVDNETRVELNYEMTVLETNYTNDYTTRKVWHSPSYSFMQLSLPTEKPRCNKIYPIYLQYTPVQKNTTANIMIISKGEIVRSFGVVLSLNDDVVTPDAQIPSFDLNEGGLQPISLLRQIDIIITPDLSPRFVVLIHYTRDDSEVVSDSIEVSIEECLQNQVLMKWSGSKPTPGSKIDLTLRAAPESLCAVSVVDKSVKLLSENNQIKEDQVISGRERFHLSSYHYPSQINNEERCFNASGRPYWVGRRKRSSPPIRRRHYPTDQADAIFAFEDAGVVVMTDLNIESRPCTPYSRGVPEIQFAAVPAAAPDRVAEDGGGFSGATRVRKYFPETWLFQLEDFGKSSIISKKLTVPDSITEWVGTTFCLSPTAGFGMSDTSSVIAFSPFFIDYMMPFSVKRGENFPLKVSMFNYVPERLPIRLEISKTPELEVVDGNYIRKFWLNAEENKVFTFNVTARKVGNVKINTQAVVSPDVELGVTEESRPVLYYSDAIEKPLLVEAEGFPQEVFESEYVCVRDGETKLQLLTCEAPANTVPDSARAKFSVTGSIMSAMLKNLDRLIVLPYGCGEQNMATFVPNIHALSYLTSIGSQDEELKQQSVNYMRRGYQRQLKYKHTDGSYSAFGQKNDEVGSLWLTAFVLKSFSQASPHVYIDDKILKQAREFIVTKQLENGCFPIVGKLFSKSLKGGLRDDGNPTLLTAYVLTALLEAGEDPFGKIVENALMCLNPKNIPEQPYAEAITAYAWMILHQKGLKLGVDPLKNKNRKVMAQKLLDRLDSKKTVKNGIISWETPDCSYFCSSVNVETAGYVLLARLIAAIEDRATLRGIAKFLVKEKNFYGSYYSTQDTVIAVEALSKFAALFDEVPLRKVEVISSTGVHTVTNDNKLLNQEKSAGSVFKESVQVSGSGCALVQCSLKYNTFVPDESPAFLLDVTSKGVVPGDSCGSRELSICVSYTLDDLESNMAVVEVSLASGYVVDTNKLDSLINDVNVVLQRWEMKDNKLNLYFDSITNTRKCFSVSLIQEIEVKSPKPANVRVYDYYQPKYINFKSYSVCEEPAATDSV